MKYTLCLILMLLVSIPSIAQELSATAFETISNNVEIPASPNAAHLGEYGALSVSKTTGSADVSIPIMTLQESGITIPINLSYKSSGLQVDERPSSVGMGWVLSAGGVISRTMRGRCDDMTKGFLANASAIPDASTIQADLNFPAYGIDTYNLLETKVSNQEDYLPDLFSFNLGGQGGSFVIGNEGNINLYEYSALKVKPLRGINTDVALYEIIVGWEVTDENGLIYTFDAIEITEARFSSLTSEDLPAYISAWYLTSISNPITNTTAIFTYDNTEYEFGYHNTTTYYPYERILSYSPDIPTDLLYDLTSEGKGTSTVSSYHRQVKFISSITLNDNLIDFTHSSSIEGFRQLNTINWSNGSSSRNFSISYSSFDQRYDATSSRLRLDSFVEVGLETKTYAFEYYAGDIPDKESYALDECGYYNGQNSNSSPVPNIEFNNQTLGGDADRSTSYEHTRIGMLSKITYPTKGATSFSYEQNTILGEATEEDVIETTSYSDMRVEAYVWDVETCTDKQYITLREGGDGDVFPNKIYEFVYKCYLLEDSRNDFRNYPTLTISESETGQVIHTHQIEEFSEISVGGLTPGNTYTFELCALGATQRALVQIDLEEYDPSEIGQPIERPVGGLRISKMEDFDTDGVVKRTRTFDYGNGGYLTWKEPIFYGLQTTIVSSAYSVKRLTVNSSPKGGGTMPVAYDKVTEWLGTQESNTGRIETNFIKKEDDGTLATHQVSNHTDRTKIDQQHYYDEVGDLIKFEDYNYETQYMGETKALRINKVRAVVDPSQRDYETDFTPINFLIYSKWNRLKSKEVIDYLASGDVKNTVTYEYSGNSHTNPTRISTSNSEDDLLHTEYTYAIDEANCSDNCFQNYTQQLLDECLTVKDNYRDQLATCKAKWNSCQNGGDCDDYYSCVADLEGITKYESCQENVLIQYKACQDNLDGCLLDEYENSIDDPEQATAYLNILNKVSTPLEIKKLKASTELNSKSVEYRLFNGLPLAYATSLAYQGGEPRVISMINKYDLKSNPIEVYDYTAGITTTYIWGYNRTLLVAKIENATYQQVYDALEAESSSDVLNDLALSTTSSFIETKTGVLRSVLSDRISNVFVTTFTHQPGIGASSITDPTGLTTYYTYDSSGRLISVLDDDGNRVKEVRYGFKKNDL